MSIKKFNELTPLARMLMTMLVFAFIAGGLYVSAKDALDTMKTTVSENKANTNAMKGSLGAIDV